MGFDMKLFKRAALLLFIFPSVVFGMGFFKKDPFSQIPERFREGLRECYEKGILDEQNLTYILMCNKNKKVSGLINKVVDRRGDYLVYFGDEEHIFAQEIDGVVSPVVVSSSLLVPPLHERVAKVGSVLGILGLLGFGYYYRDSLAELLRSPAPAIEKVQSLWAQTAMPSWAGIKSLFSR